LTENNAISCAYNVQDQNQATNKKQKAEKPIANIKYNFG